VPLRTQARGPLLFVTLERPEALNAVDPETHRALLRAWRRLREDERLKVGILSGAGERAFCAGIDVKQLSRFYEEKWPGERRARWAHDPGIGGLTRNFDPGKPIVAAIHGYCLGLGLEMALACDLRIASDDARFGLPEVRRGIIPGQGGTQRLPRAVPPNVALEMILTGEPIDARRAYEIGLVNKVVARADLLDTATRTARAIAALPEVAVRRAREAVRQGLEMTLLQGLQLEQEIAEPLRAAYRPTPAARRRPGKRRSRPA
jgi:enoyl-CoA hydratase/carnithine racemase